MVGADEVRVTSYPQGGGGLAEDGENHPPNDEWIFWLCCLPLAASISGIY